MPNAWNDFNDAEQQKAGNLIQKGTLAKVRMTIKPGGYNDETQGWTGGYASETFDTGSIFLSCEFTVLEGLHAKRKIWSNIGLHSKKGPAWANMGRSMLRGVLNSARGVDPRDNSPEAVAARRIEGFQELDGIVFVAKIDIEKDAKGEDRNVIKVAIEPDHKDYVVLMGAVSAPPATGGSAIPAQAVPAVTMAKYPAVTGKPAWAE